jgi:hypothetical protein
VIFVGDTLDTGVCHMASFADPDGTSSCCTVATRHTATRREDWDLEPPWLHPSHRRALVDAFPEP